MRAGVCAWSYWQKVWSDNWLRNDDTIKQKQIKTKLLFILTQAYNKEQMNPTAKIDAAVRRDCEFLSNFLLPS